MKMVTKAPPRQGAQARIRRLGIAEAKAKLSQALRDAPVIIHNRGRDVGVLMDIEMYERLTAADEGRTGPGGRAFLDAIAERKRRQGAAEDFEPAPASIVVRDPFESRPRR